MYLWKLRIRKPRYGSFGSNYLGLWTLPSIFDRRLAFSQWVSNHSRKSLGMCFMLVARSVDKNPEL